MTDKTTYPTRRSVLAGIGVTTAVAGVTAVTAAASDIGPNDKRLLELEQQCAAAEQAYTATDAPGKSVSDEEERRLENAFTDLYEEIMGTLPDSITGLAAKVRVYAPDLNAEYADDRILVDILDMTRGTAS